MFLHRVFSVLIDVSTFLFFFHTNHVELDANVTSLALSKSKTNTIHLSTMDLLVLATMKNAAKCENVV